MRDSWDKTDVEMVDNNSESEQGSSRGSWHRDRLNNAYNVSIFLYEKKMPSRHSTYLSRVKIFLFFSFLIESLLLLFGYL